MNERQIGISGRILKTIIDSDNYLLVSKLNLDDVNVFEKRAIIFHLKELNLIGVWGNDSYIITLKGIEAYKIGFSKYLDKLDEKEDLEIRQLKGNVFQVSKWWLIILINLGVSIIVVLLSLMLQLE